MVKNSSPSPASANEPRNNLDNLSDALFAVLRDKTVAMHLRVRRPLKLHAASFAAANWLDSEIDAA
jgi:hypothetical protein